MTKYFSARSAERSKINCFIAMIWKEMEKRRQRKRDVRGDCTDKHPSIVEGRRFQVDISELLRNFESFFVNPIVMFVIKI